MHLSLSRKILGEKATLGELSVDGVFECYTLEDVVRSGPKVWGQTAIPAGIYKVIVNLSPKFGRLMPRVLNVPGFDGILIHKGNSDKNTEGCILLGQVIAGPDWLAHSTEAFDHFFPKLKAACDAGDTVILHITNDFPQEPRA